MGNMKIKSWNYGPQKASDFYILYCSFLYFLVSIRKINISHHSRQQQQVSLNIKIFIRNSFWRTDICISMFMAALFTIARGGGNPRPLTDERINQMWCLHIIEYYSAIGRKEILAHATSSLNLEDIMQSEISHRVKGQTLYGSPCMRDLE